MRKLALLLGALPFLLIPAAASAYVGPGAGLGMMGALVAIVGAVFLAIVGLVWYPVKRMLKSKKAAKDKPAE